MGAWLVPALLFFPSLDRALPSGCGRQCAECAGGAVALCLPCLTSGAEFSAHKSGHAYRVRHNRRALSVFRENWSAAEEMALLEGLERHGLGNWKV